jgi:hypothetical protein
LGDDYGTHSMGDEIACGNAPSPSVSTVVGRRSPGNCTQPIRATRQRPQSQIRCLRGKELDHLARPVMAAQ